MGDEVGGGWVGRTRIGGVVGGWEGGKEGGSGLGWEVKRKLAEWAIVCMCGCVGWGSE